MWAHASACDADQLWGPVSTPRGVSGLRGVRAPVSAYSLHQCVYWYLYYVYTSLARGSSNVAGVHLLHPLCAREIQKEPEPYCEIMETRSYTMLHIAAIDKWYEWLWMNCSSESLPLVSLFDVRHESAMILGSVTDTLCFLLIPPHVFLMTGFEMLWTTILFLKHIYIHIHTHIYIYIEDYWSIIAILVTPTLLAVQVIQGVMINRHRSERRSGPQHTASGRPGELWEVAGGWLHRQQTNH